ncbi:18.2 kDa class I heat shock protein [Spatholobus suberectus]|nr:18.2 kDa class I heat shock protein [Spatholobus suberectus]
MDVGLGSSVPISFSFSKISDRSIFGTSVSLGFGHVKWLETATEHVFKVDVPGCGKGNVKVDMEHGKILCTDLESFTGKYNTEFILPANAEIDKVKTASKDGVLTLTVPKPRHLHSLM